MNAGQWGQFLTTLIVLSVSAFGIREIVLTLKDQRARQKIQSQAELKAMVDRFTRVNGERYEDDWEKEA